MSIHGFIDQNGQIQKYDYNDLENKPEIPAEVLIDDTLTEQGQAADAKAVGDALENITIPVDSTLTQQGAAADAKAVGDAFENITIPVILSNELKAALLQLAEKVSYIDDDGDTYYQDLYDALYAEPPAQLVSISAIYTQTGPVYDSAQLDSLRTNLVVTGHYNDGSSQTVIAYVLSGELTVGTSIITVSYNGKTTTFNVTVTATPNIYSVTNNLLNCSNNNNAATALEGSSYSAVISPMQGDYEITTVTITMGNIDVTGTVYSSGTISIQNVTGNIVITAVATERIASLSSIDAAFTQGDNIIYSSDSLSALEPYLIVTANWNDSTSSTISSTDYTLSGNLTVGTATITVSYGGKSDSFNVIVTEAALYSFPSGTARLVGTGGDVVQYTYADGGTRYLYPFTNTTKTNSTAYTGHKKRFTIPAGVTATLTVTCTEVSGSTNIASGYIWYVQAGTTNKSSCGIYTRINSVGQTATGTFTPSSDFDVGDIIIGLGNATGITLKFSLIVGNDLYIGERPL